MKNKLNLSELEQTLFRHKVKQLRKDQTYVAGIVERPKFYGEIMAHQSAILYINSFRKYDQYPEGHPLKIEFDKYL